jgi:MFS transporter, Spinster family, sphingosine-1-phosphate transporter
MACRLGSSGTWFAVIFGVGGFTGVYVGGELASRFAAGNERLQLIAMAAAYGAFGVISTFIYLSPNKYVAFGLVGLSCLCIAAANGPLFAAIQGLVPERMRAVAIAVVYLFSNLIGTGLGPLAVGTLSDELRPAWGEESLRVALLAMSPGYFWCAWHLWRASQTVNQDLLINQSRDRDAARE